MLEDANRLVVTAAMAPAWLLHLERVLEARRPIDPPSAAGPPDGTQRAIAGALASGGPAASLATAYASCLRQALEARRAPGDPRLVEVLFAASAELLGALDTCEGD